MLSSKNMGSITERYHVSLRTNPYLFTTHVCLPNQSILLQRELHFTDVQTPHTAQPVTLVNPDVRRYNGVTANSKGCTLNTHKRVKKKEKKESS